MSKLITFLDLLRYRYFSGNFKMDDDDTFRKATYNVDLSALNNLSYEDFFLTEDNTEPVVIELPKCEQCDKYMYSLIYDDVKHSKCPCCKKTIRSKY